MPSLIAAATALIGETATTIRSWYNRTVGNLGTSSWDWCSAFVTRCAADAGLPVPRTAYVPSLPSQLKDWASHGTNPQPGDIVIFDWDGNGVGNHVGILDASGTRIIEGNGPSATHVTNSRTLSSVRHFVLASYAPPGIQPPTQPNQPEREEMKDIIVFQCNEPGGGIAAVCDGRWIGMATTADASTFAQLSGKPIQAVSLGTFTAIRDATEK